MGHEPAEQQGCPNLRGPEVDGVRQVVETVGTTVARASPPRSTQRFPSRIARRGRED
jgi:hypothetical protein